RERAATVSPRALAAAGALARQASNTNDTARRCGLRQRGRIGSGPFFAGTWAADRQPKRGPIIIGAEEVRAKRMLSEDRAFDL
ncbi:hypothetical protein, partial [Escherichia coli]|uniref:hypothetical protein n=1 Tax=Escherichia coli TaxID=562 RepID=UPI0028DFC218